MIWDILRCLIAPQSVCHQAWLWTHVTLPTIFKTCHVTLNSHLRCHAASFEGYGGGKTPLASAVPFLHSAASITKRFPRAKVHVDAHAGDHWHMRHDARMFRYLMVTYGIFMVSSPMTMIFHDLSMIFPYLPVGQGPIKGHHGRSLQLRRSLCTEPSRCGQVLAGAGTKYSSTSSRPRCCGHPASTQHPALQKSHASLVPSCSPLKNLWSEYENIEHGLGGAWASLFGTLCQAYLALQDYV